MTDESYEILPYREVASLKKDIASLKQKMGDGSSKQLADSMANLSKTMDHMLNLFQSAAEEMNTEEKGNGSGSLAEINNKLDELIDQNKTIAEGIVAVADMIKEEKAEPAPRVRPSMPPPRPAPQFSPPPRPMEGPGPMPTPLGPFPQGPPPGPPPPPPEGPKKGFFK